MKQKLLCTLLFLMAWGTSAWAQTDEQYNAAITAVTDGNYRIYAETGGTKYYLKDIRTSGGNEVDFVETTTELAEATVFSISQVTLNGLVGKPWLITSNGYAFTNPSGGANNNENFTAGTCLRGYKLSKRTNVCDRQVLYYDGEAYAVRCTNKGDGYWGGAAYWGLDEGKNACYANDAAYVWHFESLAANTDVTPDAGYYRIYGSGSQAKSFLLADGENNVKGTGTNVTYDGTDNSDVWQIAGTGGTGTVKNMATGTYVNIDSSDESGAALVYMSATAQDLAFTRNPDETWYISANDTKTYRYMNFNKTKVNAWSEDGNDVVVLYPINECTVTVVGSDAETIISALGHSSKVVGGKAFVDAAATASDITAMVDGYPATCSINGTAITVTPDTDLITGRKILVALNDYEATSGTITIEEDGSAIGSTRRGAYVIYKVQPNFSGIYEAFARYGTTRDGSSLALDMDIDLEKLKERDTEEGLTKAITNTGSWTPSESLTIGSFYLKAGNTYYLRLNFLQQDASWVANVDEVGIRLTDDQQATDYTPIDIEGYGTGNALYANDFSGNAVYPFWRGWAWEPNYIHVENGYGEFYYNQEAYNADKEANGGEGRRQLKGAEITCDFKTTSEGWYGFRIYLPEGQFPKDISGSIFAQIFNRGNSNSWAGHLSLTNDKVIVSYRNGLVDPTTKVVGTAQWDKWIPIVVYFKAGRNGKGQIKVWMGDNMAEGTPAVNAEGINLGFGNWIDDNTLDDQDNEAEEYTGASLGCKFGLYVSDTYDRTIRFDDVRALEGNPANAFATVKPTVDNGGSDATPGDVDNDGSISMTDVVALANVVLGKGGEVSQTAADVNGDGTVTLADVTALVNLIRSNQ